ncbi:MAG: AhpC/TSA family protein [Chloroflexota bacterium]|nr:AhpC/TSA family protein [Chloroflexota bacterium]
MAQLCRDFSRFTEARTSVTAIGQGTPDETATFIEEMRIPFVVLSDPHRKAYTASGAVWGGARSFLSPTTLGSFMKSVLRGARFGRVVGDPRHLGGTFLIDRQGIIHYAKRSERAGDYPTTDELLGRVREIG